MSDAALFPNATIDQEIPRLNLWQVTITMAVMVLELSWAIPWYRFLTRTIAPVGRLQAYAMFGGMLLVTYLISMGLRRSCLKPVIQQGISLVVLIIGLLLGLKVLLYTSEVASIGALLLRLTSAFADSTFLLPAEFMIIIALMLAWRRGGTLVYLSVIPRSVAREFQYGVILLLLNGLISFPLTGSIPNFELYLCLFAGMLAMGGTRLAGHNRQRKRQPIPGERRWLAVLAVIAVAVLALGVILGVLVRGTVSMFVAQMITWLLEIVARVLLVVMWPVVYLFGKILERYGEQPLNITPEEGSALEDPIGQLVEYVQRGELPAWAVDLLAFLRSFILWGAVIFIAILLLRRLSRLTRGDQEEGASEREWLIKPGDLPRLLRASLRKGAQQMLNGLGVLRYIDRRKAAVRVRRIYAHLLDVSNELGSPRPASRTPLEFLPVLGRLFPSLGSELATITHTYVRVRYGQLPETHEELEAVESAWQRIRSQAEEKLRERQGPVIESGGWT
jgi:hypothetical protein